jgi:hypothetical protein
MAPKEGHVHKAEVRATSGVESSEYVMRQRFHDSNGKLNVVHWLSSESKEGLRKQFTLFYSGVKSTFRVIIFY